VRFLPRLALLLAAVAPLRAAAPLVVADRQLAVTPLAPHLEVLVDPAGQLTLADVTGPARADQWRPETRPVPAFGFTNDTLWIRFTVRSAAAEPLWLTVDLATARLSHLRWHVLEGGQVRQQFEAGSADRAPAERRSSHYPLLRLELPPGAERTVVLRVASDTSIGLPLTLAGPAAHDRMHDTRSTMMLLQMGFCLALAFLTALQGLLHRQRIYLHLVYIALAYAFYLGGFNGYLSWVWPGLPHWMEREGLMIPTTLCLLVFLRLNAQLVRRETMKRREIVLQRVGEGILWTGTGALVVLEYRTATQALNLFVVAGILAGLAVAISRFARRGGKLEASFAVAWLIYMVSILLLVLNFLNLIPVHLNVAVLQSLLLPAVLSSFFVAVAARQRAHQQAELQLERARAAETQARLEGLRYQINPHFLFNTLTSIEGLARSEPGRIPLLVSRLATFLRLRLVAKPITSLREELEGTLAYLEIEKTRFGEDLQVTCDAPLETLDWAVPELIVQPLAENAIKHGLRASGRTRIALRARSEAGRLVVTVTNPGSLAPGRQGDAPGAGVGLENIRRRLALRYGAEAGLTLAEADGIVTATLIIPGRDSR
jgi:hypothetical protein